MDPILKSFFIQVPIQDVTKVISLCKNVENYGGVPICQACILNKYDIYKFIFTYVLFFSSARLPDEDRTISEIKSKLQIFLHNIKGQEISFPIEVLGGKQQHSCKTEFTIVGSGYHKV